MEIVHVPYMGGTLYMRTCMYVHVLPRAYRAAEGGKRVCNVDSPRVDGEI